MWTTSTSDRFFDFVIVIFLFDFFFCFKFLPINHFNVYKNWRNNNNNRYLLSTHLHTYRTPISLWYSKTKLPQILFSSFCYRQKFLRYFSFSSLLIDSTQIHSNRFIQRTKQNNTKKSIERFHFLALFCYSFYLSLSTYLLWYSCLYQISKHTHIHTNSHFNFIII